MPPSRSPRRIGLARPRPPARPSSPYGVDQLDLSPEAEFVAQARDLPEIREDRVAAIRAEIASGTYETPEKLDLALSRSSTKSPERAFGGDGNGGMASHVAVSR